MPWRSSIRADPSVASLMHEVWAARCARTASCDGLPVGPLKRSSGAFHGTIDTTDSFPP